MTRSPILRTPLATTSLVTGLVLAAIFAMPAVGAGGMDLRGADLRGQELDGEKLVRADLRGADLTKASLRGANLTRADLRGADLTRADLRGARLGRAKLNQAILIRAKLKGAKLPGANLTEAVLNGADLRKVDLSGNKLLGADLSSADLRRASFEGANLRGAGFLGARTGGTKFAGGRFDRRSAEPEKRTKARRTRRQAAVDLTPAWKFVVMPDFLNQDIDYPDPNWDPVLDYVLSGVAKEKPDFVAVPGDLVNGHWTAGGAANIDLQARRFYSAWTGRLDAHGLDTVYAALGDHEIGDNPWDREKRGLIDAYRAAFARELSTPLNGPVGHRGSAYSVRHKNLQLVAVDPFEQHTAGGPVALGVTGGQLDWLRAQLRTDATHSVVMGHTPILASTRQRFTSSLRVPGGGGSHLWDALAAGDTKLYLAGEFHDVSASVKGRSTQVVSGSLPGVTEDINYLVVTVHPDRLQLDLKSVGTEITALGPAAPGESLPPVRLRLDSFTQSLGPYTRGRMTIGPRGPLPGREGLFRARFRALK